MMNWFENAFRPSTRLADGTRAPYREIRYGDLVLIRIKISGRFMVRAWFYEKKDFMEGYDPANAQVDPAISAAALKTMEKIWKYENRSKRMRGA